MVCLIGGKTKIFFIALSCSDASVTFGISAVDDEQLSSPVSPPTDSLVVPDTFAPNQVTNFEAVFDTNGIVVNMDFTAPGDDEGVGIREHSFLSENEVKLFQCCPLQPIDTRSSMPRSN